MFTILVTAYIIIAILSCILSVGFIMASEIEPASNPFYVSDIISSVVCSVFWIVSLSAIIVMGIYAVCNERNIVDD